MFKLLLISIVIAPMLLGIMAEQSRAGGNGGNGRSALRGRWMIYATLWIGLLYFLRYKWA